MSPKVVAISQAADQKKALTEAAGDLSGIDVMFNQILVAIHVRAAKTTGGIHLPDQVLKEDEFQGKVGLVLKVGPTAFLDSEEADFAGQNVKPGDWVVFRVGDGWQLRINETPCRLISDRNIRLKVAKPELIY